MNKTILKHEFKSMKWMILFSTLFSIFLTVIFNRYLNNDYQMIFINGIKGNQALIQSNLRDIFSPIFLIFTGLSLIQIFIQFRAEKDQEIGRFLKSLPVKNEDFFKVKLVVGIANLTLAFIILILGFLFVRSRNIFWIEDIYKISTVSKDFLVADSAISIIADIGLIYLVVLAFYTFLLMIQYTFSNIIGGIVTGSLVWLAPIFIVSSSVWTIERFISEKTFSYTLVNLLARIRDLAEWLLPSLYPFIYDYNASIAYGSEITGRFIAPIEYIGLKYIISLGLIFINTIIAYNFNKKIKNRR